MYAKNAQKNGKALLYVNHENFFDKLVEAMLEPVEVIATQGGLGDQSHRRHLERELAVKRREVGEIEEQLNNMRMGEEEEDVSVRKSADGYTDEVETVKNSMINLLNVMGDNPQKTNRHLREISQEAVQQMHNQQQQWDSEVQYGKKIRFMEEEEEDDEEVVEEFKEEQSVVQVQNSFNRQESQIKVGGVSIVKMLDFADKVDKEIQTSVYGEDVQPVAVVKKDQSI